MERAGYMEAARSRAHAKQTSHRHSNGRQARHINSGRLLRRHLAGFYTAVDTGFQAQGFEVLVASMDRAEDAAQTVRGWDIGNLRVAYGLDEATARVWGLWLTAAIKPSEAEIFCEPGLFWVRPDGRLYLMDISNMPWPRPDLELLLAKAAFVRESGYPARGTY